MVPALVLLQRLAEGLAFRAESLTYTEEVGRSGAYDLVGDGAHVERDAGHARLPRHRERVRPPFAMRDEVPGRPADPAT